MTPALRVADGGLGCSLQDAGRWGYQHFGVPVAGALDWVALAAANALVQNPLFSAAVEVMVSGVTLEVESDFVCLAAAGCCGPFAHEGRSFRVTRNPMQTCFAERGDVLTFRPPQNGGCFYIAVHGGFEATLVLGSVATYRRARLGGFAGRNLERGDVLPIAMDRAPNLPSVRLDAPLAVPEALRIMRGPNAEHFSNAAFENLVGKPYTVAPASDRMGLRLKGPALERSKQGELEPEGTTAGAMQVPPDGQPIMLMADRQTTGGYPRIATVISADIPLAGRLVAGSQVHFREVSRDEAIDALKSRRAEVEAFPAKLSAAPLDLFASARLLGVNLIDGVTAGGAV
jgi:biotin-dependent carboxylase-like uncharacterized protein